jgi:hypothetical protein
MIAMALSCNPQIADRRRADDCPGRDHPGADCGYGQSVCGKSWAWRLSGSPTTWGLWPGLVDRVHGDVRRVYHRNAEGLNCTRIPAIPIPWACCARIPRLDAERKSKLTPIPMACPRSDRPCRRDAPLWTALSPTPSTLCQEENPLLETVGPPAHLVACWVDVTAREGSK